MLLPTIVGIRPNRCDRRAPLRELVELGEPHIILGLLARRFVIGTDHLAFIWMNTMKDADYSLVVRWYTGLQQYEFTSQ